MTKQCASESRYWSDEEYLAGLSNTFSCSIDRYALCKYICSDGKIYEKHCAREQLSMESGNNFRKACMRMHWAATIDLYALCRCIVSMAASDKAAEIQEQLSMECGKDFGKAFAQMLSAAADGARRLDVGAHFQEQHAHECIRHARALKVCCNCAQHCCRWCRE